MLKPENIIVREFVKNILDKDFAAANKSLQEVMDIKIKRRVAEALSESEAKSEVRIVSNPSDTENKKKQEFKKRLNDMKSKGLDKKKPMPKLENTEQPQDLGVNQ